jgi:hypothetical protein
MNKIATHDSATGEKGKGLLSWIGTPFAKTQSKDIFEQYMAGCRMFDIRVKLIKGEWRCAHGLWVSKRLAEDIIKEIDCFRDRCYVTLIYEGGKKHKREFVEFANKMLDEYDNIKWGNISIKYGEGSHLFKVMYEHVRYAKNWPICKQGFLPLDGRTWHILLPIPWLWKKVYHDEPEFSRSFYTWVDFL